MKTKLLLAWRILVAAGMVGILYVVALITCAYIQEQQKWKQREYYICASRYSSSYDFEWRKGTVRLKSTETGKYITPAFNNVYEGTIKDTLTVFFHKGKRGFLDVYTGKITIPAQYERAWIFSEGLGAVVKDNKLGFINKSGETVIPCQFNWRDQSGDNGNFLFQDGYCAVFNSSGKQGIINTKGEWIIQPEYDYISSLDKDYRIVYKDKKWGLLNKALQEVFPTEYDIIRLETEGIIVCKGSEQQLYAYDGKNILQSFVYNSVSDLHYNSDKVNESGEDIYIKSDYMSFTVGNKTGLMNKTGKIVVPAIYEDISAIENDLFSCKVTGYHYGYYITINGKGEMVQ